MRASQVDTPHLSYPLQLASDGKSFSVEEQDEPAEIAGCVELILRTPQGTRDDLPEFGIPDLTFRQVSARGLPVADVEQLVEEWEPRVDVLLEDAPDELDASVRNVTVTQRGA